MVSIPNATTRPAKGGGHVFQGRYKAILAQKRRLSAGAFSIVLNAMRARMVRRIRDWA
jgi:hypothetical protein